MSRMFGVPVDLRSDGILWMVNRTMFHPHGFALGVTSDHEFVLYGDGIEPWQFEEMEETELLARFKAALQRAADLPEDQRHT